MKLLLILLLSFQLQAQDSWKFEADKQLHYEVSAILSFTTSLIASSDGHKIQYMKRAMIVGVSVGLGAGLLKECFDKARGGNFSGYDLGYDILGTATGLGLTYLIVKISNHHNKKKEYQQLKL